jgi:hypothetical protein
LGSEMPEDEAASAENPGQIFSFGVPRSEQMSDS